MVRLKGVMVFIFSSFFMYISIPYGAIKRNIRNTAPIKKFYISIPYGAIKRADGECVSQKSIGFQFLMVRLKVIKGRG